MKWRTGHVQGAEEGIKFKDDKIERGFMDSKWLDIDTKKELIICVSPIRYSQHNILRHEGSKDMNILQKLTFYPNPLTINSVQETDDGYILLGVKGKTSDQKGLGLVGAGFVERYGIKDEIPEPLISTVIKECVEETNYNGVANFNAAYARAMAVIFGSNHDSTVGFYLPICPTHNEVSIANEEHDDLLFLPNKLSSIQEVLETGKYKGINASDHVLGCLESYLINRKNENIIPKYQHK